MSVLTRLLFGIVLIGLASCGYLYLIREYEVSKLGDRNDVKLLKNPLSEDIRVVDAQSGETLFRYNDSQGIVLRQVEKLPNGEWCFLIEDFSRK